METKSLTEEDVRRIIREELERHKQEDTPTPIVYPYPIYIPTPSQRRLPFEVPITIA